MAGNIYGQLAEGQSKPEQLDASNLIEEFVTTVTQRFPPLEEDPRSIWASSFITSDWHCIVSMTYDNENYVDIFMEIQDICESMGLTLYDSGSGDVFPV